MAGKKYLLTISILASNRKDTLPKTLASIKPILDNVSSELIVVDTGCDEELLDVIRQYTDKIVKFEWCKDFAKARNTGLERAQGQWFMFIDDDEWFEDPSEIIDFFKGDDKNKYNYVKYLVRNYSNWEGTEYTDAIVGRIFKLFPGTKFVDAVHEKPINIAGPMKNLSAYAHHYGYVYKSEEERKAHLERNISLLEEQIKQQPAVPRHYAHLAQEYCTSKDYQKVIEVVESGIEKADLSTSENIRDVNSLYATNIWALINQIKYEDGAMRAMEYMENSYTSELCKAMMCFFLGICEYMLDEYEEALTYVEKYFEYKVYFEENLEELYEQSAIMTMRTFYDVNISKMISIGFATAACTLNESMLEKYKKKIGESANIQIPRPDYAMKGVVNTMVETSRLAWCASVVDWIMKGGQYTNDLLRAIMELEEKEDKTPFFKVADIMSMTESVHGYVQYLRIISARNDMYTERLSALYEKAFTSITDVINIDRMFWTIAANKHININEMMSKNPIDKWMKTVDQWVTNAKVIQLIEKKGDLDAVLHQDEIHMMYFNAAMAEAMLLRKRLDNISLEGLKDEIQGYIDESMKFYNIIYRNSIFEDYPSVLPVRCQVVLQLRRMLTESEGMIVNTKQQILKMMPRLQGVIDKYEELIKNN